MTIHGNKEADQNDLRRWGRWTLSITAVAVSVMYAREPAYVPIVFAQTTPAHTSQTIDNAQAALQAKIDARSEDMQVLQKEIESYQSQINALGSQAVSLAGTIKSLKLTQKKLEASIALTQDKIVAKNLEIQQLAARINSTQKNVADDQRIIAHAFVTMNEGQSVSLPGIILSSHSVSDAVNTVTELAVLQRNVYDRITVLQNDTAALAADKSVSEKDQNELVALNADLGGQRAVVVSTAREQASLLTTTNQSEAAYKKMVASKQAQEAALQQEISDYESQLHLNVNAALLPHTGSGVLSWPLDSIFVTQYFGNTPFASANPQVYNGMGHNGVDFRASIGTPVKAALSGIVWGTGNTDLYPGCYSFGQWIMVKHPNGLSTLYAHLSFENVKAGDTVTTGEVIGYSGNTGYTTGPHLHFGVYATQGVEIKLFTNSRNCKGATIPIADLKAYLNPLSYL